MKALVFLLLLAVASAKQYERCELARAMKANGLAGYRGISLGHWVCLAKHESDFNTKATNKNIDGSTDYGIFQISNRQWCNDESFRGANRCSVSCSEVVTDDISNAAECAKTIAKQNGLTAWMKWRIYCKNRDVGPYTAGCGI